MADPKPKTALTPTRTEDFPEWYQQVVSAADLAENSDVLKSAAKSATFSGDQ